ncbi:MAG: hypothetical protein AAFR56_19585 [Chloroflexota bacterium]
MRYIHPIAPHEKFVASGTYKYSNGGDPTGLAEHFTIHEHPDGAWFMRVDKDGRFFDGRSELIEVYRDPAGMIERYDIHAYGAKGDPLKKARAIYTFEDGMLHVGREIDGGERVQEQLELPEDYVVQPGSYLFFGYALPVLVERAPLAMVSRFGITEPVADSFGAGVTNPQVTFYGEDEVKVDGKLLPARKYMAAASVQMDSGRETVWHNYFIDEHDIFLRHDGGEMLVQLERYAHRPEKT